MAVLLPDTASAFKISEYSSIQKFARLIYGYPGIALEKEEIVIINATKYPGIANKLALRLKKYGFNIPEKGSIGSTKENVEKSTISYIWDETSRTGVSPDSQTLSGLGILFNAPRSAVQDLRYTKLVGPRIEIIL